MSWFLADDQLWSSTKRLKASTAAMGLWVCAGTWSRDKKTGGYIPREALMVIAPDLSNEQRLALAAELVEARVDGTDEHGLWLPLANGWQFYNWEERYGEDELDDESKRKLRAIRAEAGRRGAQARWAKLHEQQDGKSGTDHDGKNGFANAKQPLPPHSPSSPPVTEPAPVSDPQSEDVSGSGSNPSAPSVPSDLTGSAREDRKPEVAPATTGTLFPDVGGTGASAKRAARGPFQSDAERSAFEHWALVVWPLVHKHGHPRATPKRLSKIRARLREGFTVEQLCQVIDTVAKDPFMLGDNDRGRPYIEPENFLRSRERVEGWLARRTQGHRQPSTGGVTADEFR